MTKQTETMEWNGLTLEISLEPNDVLTRITGEAYASLKVTNPANNRDLFNDALPFDVIRSAGGTENFIDVMLSAEMPLAA
jgi:hypothetical protein